MKEVYFYNLKYFCRIQSASTEQNYTEFMDDGKFNVVVFYMDIIF